MHRNDYDLFRVEYLDRSASSFYEVPAQEREADEFAATLLFGDGALEAAIGSIGNNPMALARRFGVTEQVIKIAVRQFIRTTR